MIVVLEGSRDVSTLCAELLVKLDKSLEFPGVTWVPRCDDWIAPVASPRSKALMRYIAAYEFDVALRARVEAADPRHVFVISGLYDSGDGGFWRRCSEPIVPDVVWYVEFAKPTEDPRHAAFVRFVRALQLKDVRFVRWGDDAAVAYMIGAVLDKAHEPDVAAV